MHDIDERPNSTACKWDLLQSKKILCGLMTRESTGSFNLTDHQAHVFQSQVKRFTLGDRQGKQVVEVYCSRSEGKKKREGTVSQVAPLSTSSPLSIPGTVQRGCPPKKGGDFLRSHYPQFSLLQLDAWLSMKVKLPVNFRCLLRKREQYCAHVSAGGTELLGPAQTVQSSASSLTCLAWLFHSQVQAFLFTFLCVSDLAV